MKKQSENNEQKKGGEGGDDLGGEARELGEELATIGKVRGLIYKVRGREVMLDADLAKIYGYTTSAFNQQVVRNGERFIGDDFMFQLNKDDLMEISTSQNVISMQTIGIKGGRSKLPYAFTEQGVYMLMTVLRGELAVKQSRALVMAFKAMKDYILENRALAMEREDLKMMALVAENSQQVGKIEKRISAMDERLVNIEAKVENTVMRNEVSPVMLDFNKFAESKEYLFMDNELMEAKEVYFKIYGEAKKSIHIIDDYVDIRTLRLLGTARSGVRITIFSDNKGHHLHFDDLADFRREFPGVEIQLIRTCDAIHDRFIVVDFGCKDEVIYHCGASSKDAGRAVTMISKAEGRIAMESMHMVVERLMENPELKLR